MLRIAGCEITVIDGDISDQATEAIVNAANPTLLGGGGVDGAIHRRAGPRLLEECREVRRTTWPAGLPTGQAVLTGGGDLQARFVIHTVGPVWQGGQGGEARALADAYVNCLRLARARGISSIAFPSLSTGAYGYPFEAASRIAVSSVLDFLRSPEVRDTPGSAPSFREIRFVLFTRGARTRFETVLAAVVGARGSRDGPGAAP